MREGGRGERERERRGREGVDTMRQYLTTAYPAWLKVIQNIKRKSMLTTPLSFCLLFVGRSVRFGFVVVDVVTVVCLFVFCLSLSFSLYV